MSSVVVVEVARATPVQTRLMTALLETCSNAVPNGLCASRPSLPPAAEVVAQARVAWDLSETVNMSVADGSLSRALRFEPPDSKLERWKTVGLTIATMVDELRNAQEVALDPKGDLPPTPPAVTLTPR